MLEIHCTSILLPVVAEVGRPGNRVVGIREDRPLGTGTTVAQSDIDQVINIRQAVPVCVTRPYAIGLCAEVIWGVCIDSLTVSVRTAIGRPDGQANGRRIAGQFKEGAVAHWEVRRIENTINGHYGTIKSR